MRDIPLVWSQNEIQGISHHSTNNTSTSHHPYSPVPHHPYSSHRPYDSHMPYDSHRAYNTSRNINLHWASNQRTTLIRSEYFGASVCPSSGIPFKINHVALQFIRKLYDDRIVLSQLPKYIQEQYPHFGSHLNVFINKCKEYGWKDAPFNWKFIDKETVSSDRLSAPYTVFLYPSLACNLEGFCSKCFVDLSNKEFKGKTLLPSDLLPTLTELNDMGVFNLIILGGEPLSYPNLYELLDICTAFSFIVSMSTNGLLLSDTEVNKLSEFMDRVQVSLDGAYRESAEKLKGVSTFTPSIQAIQRLVSRKISTIVSYVLTKENSSNNEIEDFVKYMADLGVNHISFIQYYPFGVSPKNNIILEPSDNARIREIVTRIKEENREMLITYEDTFAFLNNPGPSDRFVPLETTTLGCECGRTRISIYPNGDVVPCDFLADISSFKAGNIFLDNMDDLWKKSQVLKMFRQRDVVRIEPCKSCDHQIQCRGGCQAMAWHKFKDQNMPDPRCPHVRETLVLSA